MIFSKLFGMAQHIISFYVERTEIWYHVTKRHLNLSILILINSLYFHGYRARVIYCIINIPKIDYSIPYLYQLDMICRDYITFVLRPSSILTF